MAFWLYIERILTDTIQHMRSPTILCLCEEKLYTIIQKCGKKLHIHQILQGFPPEGFSPNDFYPGVKAKYSSLTSQEPYFRNHVNS